MSLLDLDKGSGAIFTVWHQEHLTVKVLCSFFFLLCSNFNSNRDLIVYVWASITAVHFLKAGDESRNVPTPDTRTVMRRTDRQGWARLPTSCAWLSEKNKRDYGRPACRHLWGYLLYVMLCPSFAEWIPACFVFNKKPISILVFCTLFRWRSHVAWFSRRSSKCDTLWQKLRTVISAFICSTGTITSHTCAQNIRYKWDSIISKAVTLHWCNIYVLY